MEGRAGGRAGIGAKAQWTAAATLLHSFCTSCPLPRAAGCPNLLLTNGSMEWTEGRPIDFFVVAVPYSVSLFSSPVPPVPSIWSSRIQLPRCPFPSSFCCASPQFLFNLKEKSWVRLLPTPVPIRPIHFLCRCQSFHCANPICSAKEQIPFLLLRRRKKTMQESGMEWTAQNMPHFDLLKLH